jgi:hypothetical protein
MKQYEEVKKTREAFKRCSLCGQEWKTREEFLKDKNIILNGYQWNRHNVKLQTGTGGLLLFTHHNEQCGTTLALAASHFREDMGLFHRRKKDKVPVKQNLHNANRRAENLPGLQFGI